VAQATVCHGRWGELERIGTVVFRKASAEAVTAVRDVGAAIWDIETFAGIIAALRLWH
jgi:hypothetical protein